MVFSKFSKILVFLLLLTSLISLTYAQFPLFEFGETAYDPGEVTIMGQSSSGTEVNLYVNENFVGKKNVLANSKTIQLNDSIENQIIPIGASLIFRNNNPSRIYKLNVSNTIKTLNYGQSYTFSSYVEGDVLYRDEEEGISKIITISDELTNFSFDGAHTYLEDGDNDLRFVIAYPLNTKADVKEFEYTVNYEKYSNDIILNNFTNITKNREIEIQGSVSDSSSPLYYVLNIEGDITNVGVLNSIPLNGNSFNLTIPRLREGVNTLRLITTEQTNQNIFNGETKVKIISDTTPPTIDFLSVFRQFTNEPKLNLNISTDAVLLNYTFNEKNYSEEVDNGTILIDLNLKDGKNDLTLIAVDLAGNIYKEAHQIELDRENPDIRKPYKDNLNPEELFFGSNTAHFFFQKIDGRTNKPNIEMTIFTFPEGTEDRNGGRITCDMYKTMFYRNLGQLDNDRPDGPEINLNESQLSLLSLISNKKTLTTDSEGNFDAILTLQERSFDRSDYNDVQNEGYQEQIQDVDSRNTICMIMTDKYGNVNSYEETVTLDAGNTMWRPGEITTIPNTMYAAEIEQTGDIRSGSGNVEFGVIARFEYIGPGKVSRLEGFRLSADTKGSVDSKYAILDRSRMNWMLDKDTGEMVVYFPVGIRKLDEKPIDYPDKLDFAFAARVTYTVDDEQIPIDEINPIYFQTTVNIERPLDHTKWLTPETIESLQSFLNQTITLNKKLNEYLGFASIGGVIACTGAKLYLGAQNGLVKAEIASGALTQAQGQAKIDENNKNLYMICDRVVGTPSPQKCEGDFTQGLDDTNSFQLYGKYDDTYDPNDFKKVYSGAELLTQGGAITNPDGTKTSQVTGLNVGGDCDFDGNPNTIDGKMVTFTESVSSTSGDGFLASTTQSTVTNRNKCARFDPKTGRVSLQSVSSACFKDTAPEFDQTRCNFFGADENGVPGWNPKDNIIESMRCGVITDTYSHAKNILKIQEQIYMCLEQAKIGEVKGSYCERLLSQAVCDVATNVLFKTIPQSQTTTPEGDSRDPNFLVSALAGASDGDKLLNDRYGSSFLTQAGLGTEGIVNKMCLAAFTGDWSALTANILNGIDQNEVKPVFGPMFPESRFQGYNPLTGELSIAYRLTYGVVSGGQTVNSELEFFCNDAKPGSDYCPPGRHSATERGMSSDIRNINLYTPEGGVKQETVVVTDDKARYRFNEVCITHKYSINGERITAEPICETIDWLAKGELFPACSWDGGIFGSNIANPSNVFGTEFEKGGFVCDSIFSDSSSISLYNFNSNTKISPSTKNSRATLYPTNKVLLDAYFDIRPDANGNQENLNLAYYLACPSSTTTIKTKPVDYNKGNPQLITLDEIPQLGIRTNQNYWTIGADLEQGKLIGEIGATPTPTGTNTAPTTAFNVIGAIIDGQNIDFTNSVNLIPDPLGTNSVQLAQINNFLKNYGNSRTILLKLDRDVQGVNFWYKTVDNLKETQEFKRYYVELCEEVIGDEEDCRNDAINSYSGNVYEASSSLSDNPNNFVGAPIKQDITETENLQNVGAGTCTLKMRLIPNSVTPPSSVSEFNNFSVYGDNIQTDRNLNDKAYEIQFNIGRNTQIGQTSYTNFEIARPYPKQSFCAIGLNEITVAVPLVNSEINYEYESSENINRLKAKVSFAKQVRNTGELSFNKKGSENYYTTNIDLSGYSIPKGSESEEVTLYVTYTPKPVGGRAVNPKTIQQSFTLNNCEVGETSKDTSKTQTTKDVSSQTSGG